MLSQGTLLCVQSWRLSLLFACLTWSAIFITILAYGPYSGLGETDGVQKKIAAQNKEHGLGRHPFRRGWEWAASASLQSGWRSISSGEAMFAQSTPLHWKKHSQTQTATGTKAKSWCRYICHVLLTTRRQRNISCPWKSGYWSLGHIGSKGLSRIEHTHPNCHH